jgi:hypothetical protein
MLHSLESAAISLAIGGSKCAWEVAKPLVLDRELIEPPVSLNRRKGANAGRGRGFRSQPDPNPRKFREFDAVILSLEQLSSEVHHGGIGVWLSLTLAILVLSAWIETANCSANLCAVLPDSPHRLPEAPVCKSSVISSISLRPEQLNPLSMAQQ